MQLKTIFNHVTDFKPLIVDQVELVESKRGTPTIEVTMRRVNCHDCGVKVEQVPWAEGKSQLTTDYKWFLSAWARRMSWKEVAECFHVSWDHVYRSVKHAVSWGLSHRSLEGIESIGIDEVQWKRGHKYQTLVHQIDRGCKRLLWVGPERTAKTLLRFFRMLGKERIQGLQFIGSNLWQAYRKVSFHRELSRVATTR